MYAKYMWLSGATQVQMLADVCKLLTGSDVSSLSASCDKVNSTIIANTITNNWTVFDAAASASSQVLRSLNKDGTSYKFVQLTFSGNNLLLTAWESWNATTHVGTNQVCKFTNGGYSDIASTTFSTAGGTIYLYAISEILCILHSGTTPYFVCEFTRNSPVLNSTYPCHTLGGFAYSRLKYPASAGDFKVGSTPAYTSGSTQSMMTSINDGKVRKPDGTIVYQVVPLSAFACLGVTNVHATLGELQGILALNSIPACNWLDEIDVDGVRHIIFCSLGTAGFLLRKG